MKIFINNTEFEIPEGTNLQAALDAQNLGGPGYAVAMGSKVVRRENRRDTVLSEGDRITVIKAVCGG